MLYCDCQARPKSSWRCAVTFIRLQDRYSDTLSHQIRTSRDVHLAWFRLSDDMWTCMWLLCVAQPQHRPSKSRIHRPLHCRDRRPTSPPTSPSQMCMYGAHDCFLANALSSVFRHPVNLIPCPAGAFRNRCQSLWRDIGGMRRSGICCVLTTQSELCMLSQHEQAYWTLALAQGLK